MKIKVLLLLVVALALFLSYPVLSSAYDIKGWVFEDKNCDGAKNPGESGIAGVTIVLSPGSIMAVTNAKGKFVFTGLGQGSYSLTEVDPSGYCSTRPNVRIVTILYQNVTGQLFFDSKKGISPPAGCCP